MKLIRSKEWYEERIAKEGDSEIGAGMIPFPKRIIRLDDGMLFILNEDTNKYRIHLGVPHLDDPNHLHNEYSYELLMSNPNLFKIADGTEDLESMRRDWIKRTESHNNSHDDDDDCGKGRE